MPHDAFMNASSMQKYANVLVWNLIKIMTLTKSIQPIRLCDLISGKLI